jgi:hypothetical protein
MEISNELKNYPELQVRMGIHSGERKPRGSVTAAIL